MKAAKEAFGFCIAALQKKALGSFNLKAFIIQKMNFSIGFNKWPPYFLLPVNRKF